MQKLYAVAHAIPGSPRKPTGKRTFERRMRRSLKSHAKAKGLKVSAIHMEWLHIGFLDEWMLRGSASCGP